MKALKYIVGLTMVVVGTDLLMRKFNYGKGLFTTEKQMAKFVSNNGLNSPIFDANFDNWYKTIWVNLGKEYRHKWFKAVYRNTKESFPTFAAAGKRFYTIGGKLVK